MVIFGLGSETKWYSSENSLQGAGTTLRGKCCRNLQRVDILLSVQRLHCPGVFSRAKGEENCPKTSLQVKTQLIQFIALFFLSISSVSTEQWQLYAKNMRAIKIKTGEPVILMGQSIVLGEVKAETLLQNENPMNDQIIWQQYEEYETLHDRSGRPDTEMGQTIVLGETKAEVPLQN